MRPIRWWSATSISGAGGVQKLGTNLVRLSGVNTYTGPTNVTSGTLQAGSATALGSATGATFVASGATLDINRPKSRR